eukprot:12421639-Karenia_brevis.AAC.1
MQKIEAQFEHWKAYMLILSCASATAGECTVKECDQPSLQPTACHVFGCKMLSPTDAVGTPGLGGCDK